ncbi:unnamed protein product [Prunus armeniaca]|uniref:Uncharacterized protein n=1 Tax=Prunus armeniaca TaxID=36596 RepID=A0A6J5V6Z4_PRUAR|nr:unnamed protein product [Prunus armeniaca]
MDPPLADAYGSRRGWVRPGKVVEPMTRPPGNQEKREGGVRVGIESPMYFRLSPHGHFLEPALGARPILSSKFNIHNKIRNPIRPEVNSDTF